jgi:hypothetical protein
MGTPEGEADRSPLRVGSDFRLKLEFQGSRITSDARLLAYRELDDALGLTDIVAGVLMDNRTGKNGWHGLSGLLCHGQRPLSGPVAMLVDIQSLL